MGAETTAGQHRDETAHLPVLVQNCRTLNDLLDVSCRRFADQAAVGMALEEPLTYGEFYRRVLLIAARLQEMGISHGDRVAILAENSHNWVTAYMAIVRLGAAAVPILPDLPEADVHHILGEMECTVLFITQRQIEKIYDLQQNLEQVVTLDDYHDQSGVVVTTPFSTFLDEAEQVFGEAFEAESLTFPEVSGDDLASILYTSGTSGFSKAVMLTHGNLCANGYSANGIIDINPGSVFLSVLPISHTYEFTVGFILALIKGARIVYAGKTPTPAVLQKICAREKPHVMLVVPLILEKIYKKRVLPAIEQSRVLGFCCRFRMGRRFVYRKIVSRLVEFFGGRLQIMGIGGAALNPEVEAFLREGNFPYLVGYGLTESAPLISGGPENDSTIALGSAGKPVPGVEVRIDDPDPETGIGEILATGENIMQGYWNDPEATNEVFTDDGWLRTGDLGFVDEAGNLHIRGRCKSVIVMASGENIYPEAIEHKLNAYPFVVESLVLENNGVLEAWIYPDYELIDNETRGQSRTQRHQYISGLLDQMRTEVNAQLPINSRLSRILERREPFIKTATHKIKRYLYSAENMLP
ncbi:AMP-binding protein [Desulfolithobacter dissulfuricans]|uniref:AMP-binding protein n=1 Tax=Desulfolithobacter dissulfuricans TaxID=2795293 RepID=A0A915TXV0_9BACT|nr:AMP-binding protein [Desulfolithobacter dissulfuricans]BCO07758.1 AMP-binding protein [Desulfolithobacter dissulfuricans]